MRDQRRFITASTSFFVLFFLLGVLLSPSAIALDTVLTGFIGYADESKGLQTENHVIPLEELERQAIEAALMKFQGNISVAAKKLKIGQATLYRKVKKFGLQV